MSASTPFTSRVLTPRSRITERDERHDSAFHETPPSTASKSAMAATPAPVNPSIVPAIVVSDNLQGGAPSFRPITTNIPTGSLDNLFDPSNVEFSKRGSMLLGGSLANGKGSYSPSFRSLGAKPRDPARSTRLAIPSGRALSADDEMLSKKVRAMYEHGNESAGDWTSIVEEEEEGAEDRGEDENVPPLDSSTKSRHGVSFIQREPGETAGGMEDWQDISGGEVDRYGFIRKPVSRGSSGHSNMPPPNMDAGPHRVTTSLQLASEAPRRQRTLRRAGSSATKASHRRQRSKGSTTPSKSMYSTNSKGTSVTASNSRLRSFTNRLPYNHQRRTMDEAGDMLTAPPGLEPRGNVESDSPEIAKAVQKKEREREEKWRKMGKVAKKDAHGAGMVFDFDTRNGKLINRTWKGIPDRWRATAWWAFLAEAARKAGKGNPGGESEQDLIEAFNALQVINCADDVQIDVDMHRTLTDHIMFRKRFRGGQRALFRVLHAVSLYLPESGYVQGMAAIAATLLCYYEEERTFVMMTRLWQLRGMSRLYDKDFQGLTATLETFEQHWLSSGAVAQKLKELGIVPMTYATKWYLTLFNYSIPFPAQLRVWDVLMLLGDHADLDVLHAGAAALIDGMREILLNDADFENAMKVLTSWVPIKDEDLLMRVARAEWRVKRKKAGKST